MRPISCALLLCLSLQALSQQEKTISHLKTAPIHLISDSGTTHWTKKVSHFHHFEIWDERPDTTRIGLHYFVPVLGHAHEEQLLFDKPASQELSQYMDRFLANPDGPYTAVIVLRHLWLSDAIQLKLDTSRDTEKQYERTHIRLQAEIYAVKDSLYIPVFRFDTLQTYKEDVTKPSLTFYLAWSKDFSRMLDRMIDSASLIAERKATSGRRIHRNEILEFNRSRFTDPISQGQTLVPGVYASFDEFLHNAPSIQSFEVKKEKEKLLLYIKEPGGNSYYTRDGWGYCDGKQIFVMMNGCLCPAWREGKAFYFYSTTFKTWTNNNQPAYIQSPNMSAQANFGAGIAGGVIAQSIKSKNERARLYAVDMDSGISY